MLPGSCRVRRRPVFQYEGARQQAAGPKGETVAAAYDQTVICTSAQPGRTPRGQERCDIHKGLGQGGDARRERRDRAGDIYCAWNAQGRGGLHPTRRVGHKHLRSNADVAPYPTEGIRDDLAALRHDKRGAESEVVRIPAPAPHTARELATDSLHQATGSYRYRAASSAIGGSGHTTVSTEERVADLDQNCPGRAIACAAGRDGIPVAELDLWGHDPQITALPSPLCGTEESAWIAFAVPAQQWRSSRLS
jgi:hypothetical protein